MMIMTAKKMIRKRTMKKNKIAIIGGGAAGLMAAITAGSQAYVTIFESKDTLGKKICATGNGKCNFTNTDMGPDKYRGSDPSFAMNAISAFGPQETIDFFKSIGVPAKNKNGYIYPYSEEAAGLAKALELKAKNNGARVVTSEITAVEYKDNGFIINGQSFDKCIIACGSCAGSAKYADFKGYKLCESLGHHLTDLYPALVQLKSNAKFLKTINGVRLEAAIKLMDGKNILASEKGEILFADYGISGIPVLQISRFLAQSSDPVLHIDLCPDCNTFELRKYFAERDKSSYTAEEYMLGLLNHKLNFVLLGLCGMDAEGPADQFTDKKINEMVSLIKDFTLKITGTKDFASAQVVAGGVKTEEVNPDTMESKLHPGLYFAGEILDIDGTCGGYNLQWAWASGYRAAVNAIK